ncbi:prephenate dehydrogenase [Paraburkholderia rhynchosiae]|nr:prephenate dehydrogenase [Paraburkholderia rhynchosiae]
MKKRNKTAGAYSGIPGDDMREPALRAEIRARGGFIGGQPLAAAMRGEPRGVPELVRYM